MLLDGDNSDDYRMAFNRGIQLSKAFIIGLCIALFCLGLLIGVLSGNPSVFITSRICDDKILLGEGMQFELHSAIPEFSFLYHMKAISDDKFLMLRHSVTALS